MNAPPDLLWQKDITVADHYKLTLRRYDLGDGQERITGEWPDEIFGPHPEGLSFDESCRMVADVEAALGCRVVADGGDVSDGMIRYTFERGERTMPAIKEKKPRGAKAATNGHAEPEPVPAPGPPAKARGKTTDPMGQAAEQPDRRGLELSRANAGLASVTQHDPEIPFALIPIDRIERWEGNPRDEEDFTDEDLAGLVATIKTGGVRQPLLVRPWSMDPVPAKGSKGTDYTQTYSIVAGERRWRAAKLAGLAEVPCIVRELTDAEALDEALLENEQRKDISILAKARAYRRQIEQHGRTVSEIAAKTGRSVSTVYGILKLADLPDEAQTAIRAGKLPPATAQLAAQLPTPALREKAAKEVLHADGYRYSEYGDHPGEVLTYRDTKALIEKDFQVQLKGAPFDRTLPSADGTVPSCDACPKRAGNAPDEYPGVRADMCMDPACYALKLKTHARAVAEKAEAKGMKVLGKKALSGADHVDWGKGEYVDLQAKTWTKGKEQTVSQVLGEKLDKAGVETVAAVDVDGRLHKLVPRAKVNELLGKKDRNGASREPARDYEAERRLANAQVQRFVELAYAEIEKRLLAVPGLSAAKVGDIFRCTLPTMKHQQEDALRLYGRLTGVRNADTLKRDQLAATLEGLSGATMIALSLAIQIDTALDCYFDGPDLENWAKALGIDTKKLAKEAKAQMKAAKPAPGTCSKCGCTEDDCEQCVEKTGKPCTWANKEKTLCSACEE